MKSYCELLAEAPASSFHVLDPEKAMRLKGKTMVIPSPHDVARVINNIPRGETRTTADLRRQLADEANAETACPATINRYWKWIAAASEEADTACSEYAAPWWRVLKDGKINSKLPGGEEAQEARLLAEGVSLERRARK
jgi:hypothetical protein